MPHDVDRMMYAGPEVPWHGLGTQFPSNATFDEISHLFYEAREKQLIVADTNEVVTDRKALVRGDTGQYLATVGTDYGLIQFKDMAKMVVTVAHGFDAVFHTAGLLGATGARGWLLGELPGVIRVRGDESEIKKFVLAYSGHDGKTSLTFKNTSVRCVCSNTIGHALAQSGCAEWTIRHTSRAGLRMDEASKAFSALVSSYQQLDELANALARVRLSDLQRRRVLDRVLPLPDDGEKHPRIEENREKVVELYDAAIGVGPRLRGTGWGLVQAYSEFVDHVRPVRTSKGEDPRQARLQSIWLGSGAELKEAAMNAILSEAGIGGLATA